MTACSVIQPRTADPDIFITYDNACIRQTTFIDLDIYNRFRLYTVDFDIDVPDLVPQSDTVYTGIGKDGHPYRITFPKDPAIIVRVESQGMEVVASYFCIRER